VNELYDFLAHWGLPVTPDGCFLAYKRVTDDYKDFYTRKVDNRVGAKPSMPRNRVDDNREEGCSKGFHAGAIAYVKDFNPNMGHIMIVKINPKNAVSVPKDCSCTKLRICEYEVVGEYQRDLVDSPVYLSNPVKPVRQETTEGFTVFPVDEDQDNYEGYDPDDEDDDFDEDFDDEEDDEDEDF
jgi:hypothetical protein